MHIRFLRTFPLLALCVLGSVSPLSAQPANDLCGGAEVIPSAGPFPHLTAVTNIASAGTTGDPGSPSCQTYVSRSVWYAFRPAVTASYTISSCAALGASTTVVDNVMAMYASAGGCIGPFTPIVGGCNDDGCGGGSYHATITRRLSSDTTYHVVVWKYGVTAPSAGQADVQLRVQRHDPPSNDRCAEAMQLALDVPARGSTAWAADDYRLSGQLCFTGVQQMASPAAGGDVVYTFRAPLAGAYSFKVSHYALSSDLVVHVAAACPVGAAPATVNACLAASNRSTSSSSEEVLCVPLAADQLVYVIVDEHGVSAGSDFQIEVNRCVREVEPNNGPAQAQSFTQGITGAIIPSGEADVYALGTHAAGSRVFAMVDGSAGNRTDFDLRVTTASDVLEYDDADNDTPFGSNSANVSGTPLTGVPAFLRVTMYSAGYFSEPYRLFGVVQPPLVQAAAEQEPNNIASASSHAPANYFFGTLAGGAPSADVDWYGFLAQEGDLLHIALDGDPLRDNTPLNAALSLHAADGTMLVSVNDGKAASSTAGGAGSLSASSPHSPGEALVQRAAYSGLYLVRVAAGSTTTGASGAGDYLLSIARNGAIGGGGLPTDLAIATSMTRDTIISATTVVQRIVVRNLGPGPVTNLAVRDTLPEFLGFQSAIVPAGWSFSAPVVGGWGELAATGAALAAGDSAVLLVTLRADPSVPHGRMLPLCVSVTAPSFDPDPANNARCTSLIAENRTPRIDASLGTTMLVKVGCSDAKMGRSFGRAFVVGNASSAWNVGAMEWSAVTASPNLRLLRAGGVEGDSLQIAVETKGLAAGTYVRTITITARNSVTGAPAENSPLVLTVRIELEPVGGAVVSQTQALLPAVWTPFTNALGQVYAEARSNVGAIDTFTVTVHPCDVPDGYERRAYVYRWFTLAGSTSNPDVDVRFYYTDTERAMFAVHDAAALRAFRQAPALGPWHSTSSVSEPMLSRVHVRNATQLGGIWALAAPAATSVDPYRGAEGGDVQESSADGTVLDAPRGDAVHAFTLSQNAPNPIILSRASVASIDFTLAKAGAVLLTVHDMLGRTVRTLVDGERDRGMHRAMVSAAGLPPGAYVYRLSSAGRMLTRTLLIMQ